MSLEFSKLLCPLCGGRLIQQMNFDRYGCENEHVISGQMMEQFLRKKEQNATEND